MDYWLPSFQLRLKNRRAWCAKQVVLSSWKNVQKVNRQNQIYIDIHHWEYCQARLPLDQAYTLMIHTRTWWKWGENLELPKATRFIIMDQVLSAFAIHHRVLQLQTTPHTDLNSVHWHTTEMEMSTHQQEVQQKMARHTLHIRNLDKLNLVQLAYGGLVLGLLQKWLIVTRK